MPHTIERFSGQDGTTLCEQSWTPEHPARAAVVFIHGLIEHSGRHAKMALELVQRGFAVHAMDLRGHGLSEGPRADVPSFDRYLLDLDVFFARVREKEGDRPLFLMGNSMGGLISASWTILRKPPISGMMLSGLLLALADALYPRLRYLARATAAVAPSFRVPRIPFKSLSRDPAAVESFRSDPLVCHNGFTARVAAELMRAMKELSARAASLTEPLLIMHGGSDFICGPEGSRALYLKAGSADKTLHVYEGLYHELFDEPERQQVLADLMGWLEQRAAGRDGRLSQSLEDDMNHDDMRLSRIDTLWSIVRQANEANADKARQAQEALLERYGGAVRRYLLGSLRNEDAADEVFQEFSLKLVSGAFQKADANFGRFRSFLKTTLFHLIVDYQRRGKRNAAQPLIDEAPDRPMEEDRLAKEDAAWTRSWRDELLAKGWSALSQIEKSTGTPYYTVLRFRSEHPDLRSQDIAAQLNGPEADGKLKKTLNSSSVRVLIHRARELLAEQVLDLVLDSIDNASLAECEEELIELNLLEYCRSALDKRRGLPAES